MKIHQETLHVDAPRAGLHPITPLVAEVVVKSGIRTGLCQVFVRHTSASLVLQENADPTARLDLERFFEKLAPEHDPDYRHTAEGPDDMPSHLRAALTSTSELMPVVDGRLGLGVWQGLYLFEHRQAAPRRTLIITVWGV